MVLTSRDNLRSLSFWKIDSMELMASVEILKESLTFKDPVGCFTSSTGQVYLFHSRNQLLDNGMNDLVGKVEVGQTLQKSTQASDTDDSVRLDRSSFRSSYWLFRGLVQKFVDG